MKTITIKGEMYVISSKSNEQEKVDLHFLLPASSIVSFTYKDKRYLFCLSETFMPGFLRFSIERGSLFILTNKCIVPDFFLTTVKANICSYPTEQELEIYLSNSFGI